MAGNPAPAECRTFHFHTVWRATVGLIAFVATSLMMWHCLEMIAPDCSETTSGEMFAVLFVTWVALTVIVNAAFFRGPLLAHCLSPVATFFFVLCLSNWETRILVARWHANPPPRPVFCNYFVEDERVLLPYWGRAERISDERGNLMCADHEDNLLAIVINGASGGRTSMQRTSIDEYQFRVVDGSSERWVGVHRTRDALVVVRSDGAVASFPLTVNVAKAFHEERRRSKIKDLLLDVGVLLDAADLLKLNSFVTPM